MRREEDFIDDVVELFWDYIPAQLNHLKSEIKRIMLGKEKRTFSDHAIEETMDFEKNRLWKLSVSGESVGNLMFYPEGDDLNIYFYNLIDGGGAMFKKIKLSSDSGEVSVNFSSDHLTLDLIFVPITGKMHANIRIFKENEIN